MKRDIFQALADPTRRAILLLIAAQAMTPNNLSEHFEITRQAVSKHIRVLSDSGLLEQKKVGREIFYQYNPVRMAEVSQWLEQLKGQFEDRFNQLDQLLNLNEI